MAEPLEPNRPTPPPRTPGSPLPRLWKAAPDDSAPAKKKKKGKTDTDQVTGKGKKKASGEKGSDSRKKGEGGDKGVLVEETPHFDTYETRQRVRIAVGAGILAVMALSGWLIVRMVMPARPPADPPSDDALIAAATGAQANPRARDEQESRILFDRAREFAKNGKTDLAVELLQKVTAKYPNTQVAIESRQALERPRQNLPLFLDRPAVVANPGGTPKAEAAPQPANVVQATPTGVAVATGAQANLVPPANPAEPPHGTTPQPSPGQEKASRPLPKGFKPRPGTEVHASGWPLEIVGDRDGAPMTLVPGGTFVQGRDNADPSESPAHKVTLSTYYVDKHEVTVRQFNLFQKESGRRSDRVRALSRDPALSDLDASPDRPVVFVTAREASDYCYWAGKRLPTESQWEAAARTPDGRLFPWGPEPPKWSKPRAPRQIDAVMAFPEDLSPYGAFDLAGNAWEWTKDWYDPRYYQLSRTGSADNPSGPQNRPRSQQLVVKGGAKDWVVSKREGLKFDTRLPYLGFRGVLQVEGPGNAFEPPPSATPAQPATPGAPADGGSAVPF